MRRSIATGYCLIGLGLVLAAPLVAKTVRVYVTNYGDTTVDVIDPVTNKVVQVIDGLAKPHGIACSPDGSRIYVSAVTEEALDVVDQKTGKIIKKVPLTGRPQNIAITKDGKEVLVCIQSGAGALDVIDTASLERVRIIPMNGGLHNDYVTPDGKYVVTGASLPGGAMSPADHDADSEPGEYLTVIDLKTYKPVWQIKFHTAVHPMTFETNPDGSTKRIFVELAFFHGFAVIDFATHKEGTRIKLPDEPRGFEAESLPEGTSHGIGVDPDEKTLWVCSASTRCVFVYSLPDLKLLGSVVTGIQPGWISFSPDGKRAYVSNTEGGTLSVIDTKTIKQVARIPVGKKPLRTTSCVVP